MSAHDDDTCPHLVVLGRLEAENARLKAQVERLTKDGTDSLLFDPAFDAPTTLAPMGEYVRYEDYSKLKEDAERYRLASLRTDVDRLHAEFNRDLLNQTVAENTRLQEKVDKLIQAGDAVYQVLFHRRDDPALSCMVAEQWYKAKGLIP